MLPMVADRKAPLILMHVQGRPATMQANPTYANVTAEVIAFRRERIEARRPRIPARRLLVDPGIGFGKTVEHNLELLRRLGEPKSLGLPLVAGTPQEFIAEADAPRRRPGTGSSGRRQPSPGRSLTEPTSSVSMTWDRWLKWST